MKHTFEEIRPNKTDAIKCQLKGLLKDLTRVAAMGLLGLGLVFYLKSYADVLIFSTMFPGEVRNAIVVHNQGEKVKQAFIDDIYSKSIK